MEHLREFGTVKAIGGGNADIYRILGRQASIAAVAGFVLGAHAVPALRPGDREIDLELDITPRSWRSCSPAPSLMCLAAAMFSFRKVASIDPALVFRSVSRQLGVLAKAAGRLRSDRAMKSCRRVTWSRRSARVGGGRRASGRLARPCGRRGRLARGPVGLGQDDVAVDPRLHPDADQRARSSIDGEEVDPRRPARAAGRSASGRSASSSSSSTCSRR